MRGHVRLVGMRGLTRQLNALPTKVRNKVVRPAINQASTIVLNAAKRLAPMGDGPAVSKDGTPRVRLRKAIAKRIRQRRGTVVAAIGPKYKVAPHDHLVHDGTKPHSLGKKTTKTAVGLGTSKRGRVNRRRRVVSISQADGVRHPGAKAQPYMKEAYDQTRGQVVSKLKSVMAQRLKQVR